jgi:hypothetical protein
MRITPCTDIAGLYLVEDVYDVTLLDQFLAEDHDALGTKQALTGQEDRARDCFRSFDNASVWTQLLSSVDFSPVMNLQLKPTSTAFWKDYPGWSGEKHADNMLLQASMQVYLGDSANPNMGTKFYPAHTVAYRKNTGYLMINLGQLHGGCEPMQELRYSTYTWLKLKS